MPKIFCRNCACVAVIHVGEVTTAKACLGCGLVGDFSDTHPKHEYSANDRRFLRSIRISATDQIDEDGGDDGA